MRLEASEYIMKHEPCFILYDTIKKNHYWYNIPCKPSNEVLSTSAGREIISGEYTGVSDAFLSEKEIDDIKSKLPNLVGGSFISYPLPTERLVPAR
jgi:hypothetical protein